MAVPGADAIVLGLDFNVWERMEDAILKVRQRLIKASDALLAAEVPFAVIGGNAVAAWVGSVEEAAVRNTRDVDMMVDRDNFGRMREALESVGFVYRHIAGMDIFLDAVDAKAVDGVRTIFARERVNPESIQPNPDLSQVVLINGIPTIALAPLVEIKLSAWRRKDQVHLLDMIGVGFIDASWLDRLPPVLAARLKELLDDPHG